MKSTLVKWIFVAGLASVLQLAVNVLGLQGNAFAQSCYETTVQSPTPFMGNDGEIVKLADGSLWEVKYAYEYLYEYYPSVIICPKSGKLMIKKTSIDVQLISPGSSADNPEQATIESTIISRFEGLKAGNVYKLANGQMWEQVDPWVWVWIWVNPNVTIYAASGSYKMKVDNIENPVFVRRLKLCAGVPTDARPRQVRAHPCRCTTSRWQQRQLRAGQRRLVLVVSEVCARRYGDRRARERCQRSEERLVG